MNQQSKTTVSAKSAPKLGFVRDIPESDLPGAILSLLLLDHSTDRNILWAAEGYGFAPGSEMLAEQVAVPGEPVIRPRVDKPKDVQQSRVKKRAEVFTPSWLCSEMIDEPDRVIHTETGDDFRAYIHKPVLEITCGEASFLANRYDAVSGEMTPVPKRIGLLDRKILSISKYCRKNAWLNHALSAVRATYGFEWQGDNLLIARENILASVVEHYWWRWYGIESTDIAEFPHQAFLRDVAETISWNLWQMDGLRFVVPMSCHDVLETDLLGDGKQTPCEGCARDKRGLSAADSGPYGEGNYIHNGIQCSIILDWETREAIRFIDIVRDGRRLHGR